MNVFGMLQFQISRIFFDVQDYHQKSYVLRLRQSESVQYAGSMLDFLTAHRPRTGGATSFGDALQLDLFQWQGQWYLLLIDEATRFKMCDAAKGLEAEPLMEVLLNSWIYLFGPPSRIIMDQQVALMSHETGAEFERLGITRSPRGTTAGKGSDQHTGTGLAERHVGLMKLTMWKVKAELNRQGIVVEDSEVAKESAMAQNLTINYHGATPAMSVFGTLPRGFL